jgi:hypothetical protein
MFYSEMINSSLHRIDWGTETHRGVVVTYRVRHCSTLKHLTISGTYINQLSFACKYSGSPTLPHFFVHAKYYFYVTGVTEEPIKFYGYALMAVSTHEDTIAGTQTHAFFRTFVYQVERLIASITGVSTQSVTNVSVNGHSSIL